MSLETIFDEALRHHQLGRVAEAERGYKAILQVDPNHANSLHLLGVIAYEAGDCETAIERIRQAVQINPQASSYHLNLGNVLQHLGMARDAGSCYLRALMIKPDLVEAQVNLANLFLSAEDTQHALEWYRNALALRPELPEVHKKIGDAYRVEGDQKLALRFYKQAIALRPGYADALHELGILLRSNRDLEGALACFRQARENEPDHPRAAFSEALVLLLQGNFREGWDAYECRWRSTDHATPMRPYKQQAWHGESIADGALLLWPEQGLGDEIMFSASIAFVARIGIRCILECDPRLVPLFARSFPTVEVVSDRAAGFDSARGIVAQLPVGSLPGIHRRRQDEFPTSKEAYLHPDPLLRQHFRARYAGANKVVGLAWNSNNVKTGADRSIDLSILKPLFADTALRWVSLQYGDFTELEGQIVAADVPVYVDFDVDQLKNIDDFAAQVAAMNLVITIDNTTAHLAGALGVPVWLLLPFAPDWRWSDAANGSSSWYSSMRIFQQPERGDWKSVAKQVNDALQTL